MSYFLISGRCLGIKDVNITLFAQIWGPARYPYKESYHSPVWFDRLRGLTKNDFDYLKSIDANPNTVDDLGRTALILEIQERLYLNDYLVHNFNTLPKKEQSSASEEAVRTAKLLIDF